MTAQDDKLSKHILRRYEQMRRWRDPWRSLFTLLSKYILMRPVWFGDVGVPYRAPRLSIAGVSDDETVEAARTSATALGGALWPNTAESFELIPSAPMGAGYEDDLVFDTQEVKDYFERITEIVRSKFDQPEAAFAIAWQEHLDDQVVFGTSGIFGIENEEDDRTPFAFRSVGVETAVISEGRNGLIDTVCFEHIMTARQVVETYGIENVSERVRGYYEGEKYDDWVKVLQMVEPRPGGKVGGPVTEKPYSSTHMEADTKWILKTTGIDEMPIYMTRFRKRPNEIYGRSLGMDALPSVKELNVLRKAYTLALDKILDPPYGFFHDQIGGGGNINLSAGARVPLYATGRIPQGQLPVVPLLNIKEPQVATQRIEQLTVRIGVKFLNDRLLDFNNKTRMTLGEAQLRNDFRNQALGNIFSRQIIELLVPLISWAVHVMWRRKMLGLHPVEDAHRIAYLNMLGIQPLVIPDAVIRTSVKGKLPFAVRMISPAARAMKADSLVGLEKLANFALTLTNAGHQDVGDNFDADEAARLYQDLAGAPVTVMRGKDKVEKIRKDRAAAQAQQAKLMQAEATAKIQKDSAKAAKDGAQAGISVQQAQQGGLAIA